jgi:hexosaminidase
MTRQSAVSGLCGGLAVVMGLAFGLGVHAAQGADVKLLPTPKSIKVTGGEMPLTAESRIVATDPKLMPLAKILSGELCAMTGIRMDAMAGEPRAGDIVLKLNPELRADNDILTVQNREVKKVRDYAHTITIADTCVVEGWDYRSVCEGTATLLQALIAADGRAALPKMTVKDWPFADYTGYMIDCARQDVSLHALKSCVIGMRFWKIRYLHLHLADESTLMFPLRKWPQASKHNAAINNGDRPKVWDREELIKLVAFADARGVTLVPEFETPGHCGGYQAAMEPALGDCDLRMMDVADDSIYPNLEEVVDDMCSVFTSTPYFHIGGDEIELDRFKKAPHVPKYLQDHGMREIDKGGIEDLLKQHVLRMNEFVKKNGKKTIYWGISCSGLPQDPELKDVIVYSWHAGARDALDKGMTIITVPWEIRGPRWKWNIFNCNSEQLKRTDSVLGGSRVAWESDAEGYVNSHIYCDLRPEGTWNVDTEPTSEAEIQGRAAACNANLEKILRPVTFKLDGKFENGKYSEPLTVTVTGKVPAGCSVHYAMDSSEPTPKSPRYGGPFQVTGTLRPRAAIFDDKTGELVGGYVFGPKTAYRGFEQSLTTGKPVVASGPVNDQEMAVFAADGYVDIAQFWGSIPSPQTWKVDLQSECKIGRVQVVPYWDGVRYYQYTVEVSTDGEKWKQVVDAGTNTEAGTEKGYTHTFDPVKARHVRVNMLKNSDNPAVHLVEVRVFEAAQ